MVRSMDKTESRNEIGNRIILGEMCHVCLAVKDVEKTAEAFSTIFGIGPFRVTFYESPSTKATVYGKPQGYRLKFAHAEAGPVDVDLDSVVSATSALISNPDWYAIITDPDITEVGIGHIYFETTC